MSSTLRKCKTCKRPWNAGPGEDDNINPVMSNDEVKDETVDLLLLEQLKKRNSELQPEIEKKRSELWDEEKEYQNNSARINELERKLKIEPSSYFVNPPVLKVVFKGNINVDESYLYCVRMLNQNGCSFSDVRSCRYVTFTLDGTVSYDIVRKLKTVLGVETVRIMSK